MADRFRQRQRVLTDNEDEFIYFIKESAEALEGRIEDALPAPGREKSLALTKLEEAVMWAIKGRTA